MTQSGLTHPRSTPHCTTVSATSNAEITFTRNSCSMRKASFGLDAAETERSQCTIRRRFRRLITVQTYHCPDLSLAEAVSPATKRPRPGEVHPGSYETSRPSSRAINSMDLCSHIVVPCRTTRCLAAVLWFHGFGDGPEGWHREFAALAAAHPATTWIFPRAPKIRQTCYEGMLVSGWGDYLEEACTRQGSTDYDNANIVDATVLKSARNMLDDVMRSGVPPSRVAVGGFSMGATAAAEIAICRNESGSVGALIMLNGFLAVSSRAAVSSAVSSAVGSRAAVSSAVSSAVGSRAAVSSVSTLPLRALVSHGSADEQVGFDIGSEAARLLREAGVDVTLEVQRGMKHVESGFGPGKAHAAKFLDSFLSHATREADTVQAALAPAQRPPRADVASPLSAEDEVECRNDCGAFHSAAFEFDPQRRQRQSDTLSGVRQEDGHY